MGVARSTPKRGSGTRRDVLKNDFAFCGPEGSWPKIIFDKVEHPGLKTVTFGLGDRCGQHEAVQTHLLTDYGMFDPAPARSNNCRGT